MLSFSCILIFETIHFFKVSFVRQEIYITIYFIFITKYIFNLYILGCVPLVLVKTNPKKYQMWMIDDYILNKLLYFVIDHQIYLMI